MSLTLFLIMLKKNRKSYQDHYVKKNGGNKNKKNAGKIWEGKEKTDLIKTEKPAGEERYVWERKKEEEEKKKKRKCKEEVRYI